MLVLKKERPTQAGLYV